MHFCYNRYYNYRYNYIIIIIYNYNNYNYKGLNLLVFQISVEINSTIIILRQFNKIIIYHCWLELIKNGKLNNIIIVSKLALPVAC